MDSIYELEQLVLDKTNVCYEKHKNGTLTVGEVFGINNHYCQIRNGKYAGRVLILTYEKINDKRIYRFANGMTWVFAEDVKDYLCNLVHPYFTPMSHYHTMDYSQSQWYHDNGSGPYHNEW